MSVRRTSLMAGTGVAAGLFLHRVLHRPKGYSPRGEVVFITGGSRGLGLVLAREFASRGASVVICARDRDELDRAHRDLLHCGSPILTVQADLTLREEAESAFDQARRKFGPIDILINNAGTIGVGPLETTTIDDFRNSLETHFWAPYFATMAVLPEMRERKQGRIVNISSIGGKISVPHLLPYSTGKFALTGFSQGLRAELRRCNIFVTTVCPGLMRTGSPRNALFKGNTEAEYAWFSISDSLPVVSMSAERAARKILKACVRGDSEVVLSVPAKLAVKAHALFPGLTTEVLSLVNRLLPAAGPSDEPAKTGNQSFSDVSPSWLTNLNERAAARNNQIA